MEQDEASEEESLADEANSESDTSPAPGKAKPSAGRAGKVSSGGRRAHHQTLLGKHWLLLYVNWSRISLMAR